MARLDGTDLFYLTMKLEPETRINYVFLTDYAEATDPRNPRTSYSTILGRDMEMTFGRGELPMSWFAMPKWRAPDFLNDVDASKRGRIESREIESKVFANLKLRCEIYLPATYDANADERYPVAYIHGGKNAMDRAELPKAFDNLIGSRCAPFIAVFVGAPPARNPGEYPRAFVEEIIPAIDAGYRTRPEPAGRASIGAGMSGLNALAVAFHSPRVVAYVGVQSPLLLDAIMREFRTAVPQSESHPLRFYYEWGKYELRNPHENWDIGAANREFAAMLKAHGFDYAGGEVPDGTDWPSWKTRSDRLYMTLFPLPR